MKVDNEEHLAGGWVMGEIAPDFTLLDAWELPVTGTESDFAEFVQMMWSLDPKRTDSASVRSLFRARAVLGRLLRLDSAEDLPIPAAAETTLASRLPDGLRSTVRPDESGSLAAEGFTPLFRTEREAATEISNRTVHGVLQLAWVKEMPGEYRGRLGVYVKPRGLVGRTYLQLIGPFRHLIVYPALLRQIERMWAGRTRGGAGAGIPHDS